MLIIKAPGTKKNKKKTNENIPNIHKKHEQLFELQKR